MILRMILMLLVAASPSWAQSRRAEPVDLTGKWDLAVTSEGQAGTAVVDLVQKGDSLIGRYTHQQLGDLEVVGSVKGKDFAFAYSTAMNGQTLTFTVKGIVQGPDSLTGTASLGPMGSANFIAKRQRQR
ncbi:MAG TPA: hypothetical protein VF981_11500 [Gemmatimonadaceae bacterium]